MRRQRRWGVEIIAMLIMSKIIIVVNAALLGCSLEAGEGLGRLPTRGPEGGRGVLSWGGGSYVASPPKKTISCLEPGRASEVLARRRAGSFTADAALFFPFLSPGPQWLVLRSVVSQNSWEPVVSVCPLPSLHPVPPSRACYPSFSPPADEWWL